MEWPSSSNGVACFAPDGKIVDVPAWAEEAGFIADCYALTPAGSGAWASLCLPDRGGRGGEFWKRPGNLA